MISSYPSPNIASFLPHVYCTSNIYIFFIFSADSHPFQPHPTVAVEFLTLSLSLAFLFFFGLLALIPIFSFTIAFIKILVLSTFILPPPLFFFEPVNNVVLIHAVFGRSRSSRPLCYPALGTLYVWLLKANCKSVAIQSASSLCLPCRTRVLVSRTASLSTIPCVPIPPLLLVPTDQWSNTIYHPAYVR